MVEALAIGIAAGVAILAFYGYQKVRLARLRSFGENATLFYGAIDPLISDKETPVEVLDFIQFLNALICERRAARDMWHIVSGGGVLNPSAAARQRIHAIHEFFDRRPELREPYSTAVVTAMLCVTYSGSIFYGRLMRIWLSSGNVAERGRTEPVGEDVTLVYKFERSDLRPRIPAAA